MGAYTLVDSNVRKKLDEMLKTWKEPVPGSLDTHPVFPIETVREIENALIKARTAAMAQQARTQSTSQLRAIGTPPSHWRNTPPPHPAQQYGAPPSRNGGGSYNSTQVCIAISAMITFADFIASIRLSNIQFHNQRNILLSLHPSSHLVLHRLSMLVP